MPAGLPGRRGGAGLVHPDPSQQPVQVQAPVNVLFEVAFGELEAGRFIARAPASSKMEWKSWMIDSLRPRRNTGSEDENNPLRTRVSGYSPLKPTQYSSHPVSRTGQ